MTRRRHVCAGHHHFRLLCSELLNRATQIAMTSHRNLHRQAGKRSRGSRKGESKDGHWTGRPGIPAPKPGIASPEPGIASPGERIDWNVENFGAPQFGIVSPHPGIDSPRSGTTSPHTEMQFGAPGIVSATHGIGSGRPDAGSPRVRTRAFRRGWQSGNVGIRLGGHGTGSDTPITDSGHSGMHAGQSGIGSPRKEIHISHSRGGSHEPGRPWKHAPGKGLRRPLDVLNEAFGALHALFAPFTSLRRATSYTWSANPPPPQLDN